MCSFRRPLELLFTALCFPVPLRISPDLLNPSGPVASLLHSPSPLPPSSSLHSLSFKGFSESFPGLFNNFTPCHTVPENPSNSQSGNILTPVFISLVIRALLDMPSPPVPLFLPVLIFLPYRFSQY